MLESVKIEPPSAAKKPKLVLSGSYASLVPTLKCSLKKDTKIVATTRALKVESSSPHRSSRRDAQRRRRLAELAHEVKPEFLSYLEHMTVRRPTRVYYHQTMEVFLRWVRRRNLSWTTDNELDAVVVLHFDERFFKGASPEVGSSLVATLKHFIAEVRIGGRGALPRAQRALASWRKLRPTKQRLPLPRIVLLAMAGTVVALGFPATLALKWVLMFHTYMRLGECDALTGLQLAPPSPLSGHGYLCW